MANSIWTYLGDDYRKSINAKTKAEDKALADFEARVGAVQKILMNRVTALAAKLETDAQGNIVKNDDNLALAARSLATLRRSLTASGYHDAVADLVAGYKEQIPKIIASGKALNIPMELASSDKAELRTLQTEYLSEFEQIGDKAVRELKDAIYQNTLGGLPLDGLNKRLGFLIHGKDKKGGTLKRYAKTYARTSLMGYDRHANAILSEATGLQNYTYLGPRDDITRPFCEKHINRVYTLDEIKKLDNGQGLPVREYGGGWNCRHFWQVLPDDLAEDIRKAGKDLTPPKPKKTEPSKKPYDERDLLEDEDREAYERGELTF